MVQQMNQLNETKSSFPSSSSFSSGGFKRTRAYLEERERYSS